MCDKVFSEDHFLMVYCSDKYTTQKMCDKAVHDSLGTLKFIPNWFVTSKMSKKLFTALYVDENILYLMKILVMLYLIVLEWVFLI